MIDEVRLSLQDINTEMTEVNRGNIFSTAWQGPMMEYYEEAERTTRAGHAILEKMNQKYDEYLQRAFVLTPPARYVGNRLKESDHVIHQLFTKMSLALPHAHVVHTSAQQDPVPAAASAEEPEALDASSPEEKMASARAPKRKASERFYKNLQKKVRSKKTKHQLKRVKDQKSTRQKIF
jgi:hypothetical protein